MAKREENITVDLHSKSFQEITLKQLDTTKLIFTILDNNQPYSLTNLSASIFFVKPNNTVVEQSATISSGKVVANLLEDCVRDYGRGKVEVELSYNDEVISSFQVNVNIEKSGKGNVTSGNSPSYYEDLQAAKNYANAAGDYANDAGNYANETAEELKNTVAAVQFVSFKVDDDGELFMHRTTDMENLRFRLNEETGDLEVNINGGE